MKNYYFMFDDDYVPIDDDWDEEPAMPGYIYCFQAPDDFDINGFIMEASYFAPEDFEETVLDFIATHYGEVQKTTRPLIWSSSVWESNGDEEEPEFFVLRSNGWQE